jgi:hypothetical protein
MILSGNNFYKILTSDTIPPLQKKDSALLAPLVMPEDSGHIQTADTASQRIKIDTIQYKISKDTLDAPVIYHADDSMVFDVPKKKILLF